MSVNGVISEKLSQIFFVKPHELAAVVFYLALFVLLGAGLALGRGTADALFFKRYGIEYLPVMFMVTSLFLAVVCTVYAAFADRLASEKFFQYLLGLLALAVIVAWFLMEHTGQSWAYPFYYIIYEIASELVLIHAGLYLNQNMDASQARRLVPVIFGGSQVGMIMGGGLLALLSPLLGVGNTVLVWAMVSVAAIVMLIAWHRQRGTSPFFRSSSKQAGGLVHAFSDVKQGVQFMGSSALLRAASLSLFFMVIMFYVLIYSVNQIYTATFQTEESLSSFFGILTAANSALALLIQFFLANRLLNRFGVKRINLLFPLTSLFSYVMLLVSYALPSAILGSVNKDVVMTAFRNPVWNLMLNALPRNIQGRSRAMTVAIVIPLALLCCGGILLTIQAFGEPTFVIYLGLLSAALYMYYTRVMNNCYVREIVTHLKQKLSLPEDISEISLGANGDELLQELRRGVLHPDDQISKAYAMSLITSHPDKATEIIVQRLPQAGDPVHDQLIRMLVPLKSPLLSDYLWDISEKVDDRTKATCYRGLLSLGDNKLPEHIPGLLQHEYSRLRGVGILGVHHYRLDALKDTARQKFIELLSSDDHLSNFVGLELCKAGADYGLNDGMDSAIYKNAITNLLESGNENFQSFGLNMARHLNCTERVWLRQQIERLMQISGISVRIACLYCSERLDDHSAETVLENALEDAHPYIRELAAHILAERHGHNMQIQLGRLNESMGGSPRMQASLLEQLIKDGASKELLQAYAESKADEAGMIEMALNTIKQELKKNSSLSLEMLRVVLEERLENIVDLTLQAMQGSEDKEVISSIRLGIQSGDAGYRASGCEALHNLDNARIGRSLAVILEAGMAESKTAFENLADVLGWCLERDDPWLIETANNVQLKISA